MAKSSVKDTGSGRLDKLLADLAKKHEITIGVHAAEGGAQKDNLSGGAKTTEDRTLVEVVSDHEFGVGVPRRSIVADWFEEDQPAAKEALKKIQTAALQSGTDPEVALGRFAAWAVGRMQRRMVAGIAPELSERRKAEKERLAGTKKDTPLILTGQIRSSLRGKVDGKG